MNYLFDCHQIAPLDIPDLINFNLKLINPLKIKWLMTASIYFLLDIMPAHS